MAVHGLATRPLYLERSTPLTQFREDVLAGLRATSKTLPSKYLYDQRGSDLFSQICDLPEYYPTRTELSIMRRYAGEMADALGGQCLLIEYGSGSSMKTPLLLERLRQPSAYVPVDISREELLNSATVIRRRFPNLEVLPVWADFTSEFEIPVPRRVPQSCGVYFPGSTIGNFGPDQAVQLMEGIAEHIGPAGGFLVGVDLWKSASILHPAYDDRAGVTAAFNKNMLVRINRELGANFDLDQFEHRAVVNDRHCRVEMHLVSRCRQTIRISGVSIGFLKDETICTEHSNKYTLDSFRDLTQEAGLSVKEVWTDANRLFSVQYLEVAGG